MRGTTRIGRAAGLVALALVLGLLAGIIPLGGGAQAAESVYGFSSPGDYTYNGAQVEVSGGAIRTRALPLDSGYWEERTASTLGDDRFGGVAVNDQGTYFATGSQDVGSGADMFVTWGSADTGKAVTGVSFIKPGTDGGHAVAVGPDGSPVVVGTTSNGSDLDLYAGKFPAAGAGTELWKVQGGGINNDALNGVAVGSDNNPVLVGHYCDASGNTDIWIRNADGQTGGSRWQKTVDSGKGYDSANAVAVGPDLCPVVVGEFNSGSNTDIWVRKYDSQGNALWTSIIPGTVGPDAGTGVAIGPDGDPVVCGNVHNGADNDIWVMKYDGRNGQSRWSRLIASGKGWDQAFGVAIGPDGNPVVSGHFESGTSWDLWVNKFNGATGGTVWNRLTKGGVECSGRSICCDATGNVIVAGYCTAGTTRDLIIKKYPPGKYASMTTVGFKKPVEKQGQALSGFMEKPGSKHKGSITYQLSPNGKDWYYYSNGWKKATGPAQSNSAGEVDLRIGDFDQTAASKLYLQAFLQSSGLEQVELDAVTVYLSPPVPSGNSDLWFLAEGSTDWGFSTYISILNPNPSAVNAEITYMTGTGAVSGGTVTMPAMSQATIDPAQVVPATDFSTRVRCVEGLPIAVDRTMSWTGTGAAAPESHSSIGVTWPSCAWCMPEGSSAWGFETWTCVQNPNQTNAQVTVTYMMENDAPVMVNDTLPPLSRRTYSMKDHIGEKDASIKVTSDVPVIPERAMYRNNRREGHESIPCELPGYDYYLAEGSTAWGFTTYLLIQNNNKGTADVTVTYMTSNGPVIQPTFQMPMSSRKTIRVNDVLPNADFSIKVSCPGTIIAERAMYWNSPTGEVCHDSVGTADPHTTYHLPDGDTTSGTETWTLVQNPNGSDVQVEVQYLTPDGKGNKSFTDTVPANSRRTYSMADHITNGRAGIVVTSKTTGAKIIVERSMYSNGRQAGTDTIGGYRD
ncbi:MAG: hypothetical protein V1748_08635 [Actinomycetota bacterium]